MDSDISVRTRARDHGLDVHKISIFALTSYLHISLANYALTLNCYLSQTEV